MFQLGAGAAILNVTFWRAASLRAGCGQGTVFLPSPSSTRRFVVVIDHTGEPTAANEICTARHVQAKESAGEDLEPRTSA